MVFGSSLIMEKLALVSSLTIALHLTIQQEASPPASQPKSHQLPPVLWKTNRTLAAGCLGEVGCGRRREGYLVITPEEACAKRDYGLNVE